QDWGRHEISYGIAGHSGDWRSEHSYWQAYGLEPPAVAFQTGRHGGRGRSFSLCSVDSPSVRVLACKQAEDSDELILRVVELDGQGQSDVRVNFGQSVLGVREVDGQEYGDAAVSHDDSGFSTSFSPYQIRTFAVT